MSGVAARTVRAVAIVLLAATFPVWAEIIQAAPNPAISAGEQTALPSLEMPESSFDFGEVFAGQVISHTFKVKNTGAGILTLKFKDSQTPNSQTPDSQAPKPAAALFQEDRHSRNLAVRVAYKPSAGVLLSPAAAPI
ncbi:MAG TPA: hypothetical protein VEZ90_02265 [Blastocatellia bacterium]|nr:hypothetical protein [Blastocatellia bacterium]